MLDFKLNVTHSLQMRPALSILLIMISTVATARAADIKVLKVEEHQGRYTITLDALLNAPRENIYTTITTPALWPQLSHTVIEAKKLGRPSDARRMVRVVYEDCIFFICQTIHKNETLTSSTNGHIDTQAIPGQSDFSYAHEHWRVSTQGQATRVEYSAEMIPNFYIPPLIGPYFLKAKIRSFLLHVTTNLESMAGS
jgi:hypothetical protein